jgi:hypothetical protein
VRRVTRLVADRKNRSRFLLDQEEDRVGETPGQCTVSHAVDDREAEWILFDRRKDLFDRRQELLAESLPLALVPVEGLDQLGRTRSCRVISA